MSSNLVLGIDCSTTACKALVLNDLGQAISTGLQTIPISNPKPDWFEQRAENWQSALVGAIRLAINGIESKRLAALCITHQRETFVPVDSLGRPSGPAIVWLDERARYLLPELKNLIGAERFHQITGKPLTGNLTFSKIAWLRENDPDLFHNAAKYLDVHAFLVHFLTGHFRTSTGSAGSTGLFDIAHECWSEELLATVGLRINQFPETYSPCEILGTLSSDAAKACALPSGLPVVAGIGDGQAVGIGANITRTEDAYLSLGTSVIGGHIADVYETDIAFRTMISAVPGTYFLETVLLGGAYTISWLMENFIGPSYGSQDTDNEKLFEAAGHNIPAGSEGLLCVPYWNSVMNPYWDASASGVVIGWRGHHTPQHLYRAILEGIAFELRLHKLGIESAIGSKLERYIAVGGGAQNALWCQIIADVTGVEVQRTIHRETAALGAGIMAAAGVGIYKTVTKAGRIMTALEPLVFKPDIEQHELYREIFDNVYQEVYPALQSQLSQLAVLQENHS